ncbi:MAG: DNA primase [Solirubrobacterales bacterium]|nr:DNA primase [Solirubrobacterales bacterium]
MVEIVSAKTDLRRQGVRYTGLCPFHEERTPSFSVHSTDKLYHCFGCGVGGDLFDFVAATENIDFPAAVELLADRYGVEVTREKEDPEAEQRRRARTRLTELLDRAASFYAATYQDSPEAAKARDYLEGRGLDPGALADFGVGYAPGAWDTLIVRGQQAGFSLAELARTGLAQKSQKGAMYDRFRKRITFPIRDPRGRVVGFGARATGSEQKPKYLNSAEGELFHKSEILYGIDRARAPMAKAGRAIVVEGYTDVIALHQVGLTESVGVMGTAITEPQLAMLSATIDTVILALDADAAGRKAMLRAQQVAAGRKLTIRVAAMPAGEDPAEMVVAEGGADRFRELVDGAVELPEFHLELILGEVDTNSPQSRDSGLAQAAPVLAGIAAGATREELTRRVAERLGIDPTVVVARLSQAPEPQPQRSGAPAANEGADAASNTGRSAAPSGSAGGPATSGLLTRRERQERSLLAMCVARPAEGRTYLDRLEARHLSSPLVVRTAEWLRDHLDDPAEGLDPDDRELHGLIAELVVGADPDQVGSGSIRRNFMELELAALEDEIRAAAAADDPAGRAELSRKRSKLVEAVRRAEADAAESGPDQAGHGLGTAGSQTAPPAQ